MINFRNLLMVNIGGHNQIPRQNMSCSCCLYWVIPLSSYTSIHSMVYAHHDTMLVIYIAVS